MVTTFVDMSSRARCVELNAAVLRDSLPCGPVETAYILNESALQRADPFRACEESAVGNKVAFEAAECCVALTRYLDSRCWRPGYT